MAGSRLVVYDALGNVVRSHEAFLQGKVAWDTTDATDLKLAAGLYFTRLTGGATRPTAKPVLLD